MYWKLHLQWFLAALAALIPTHLTDWLIIHHFERLTRQCARIGSDNLRLPWVQPPTKNVFHIFFPKLALCAHCACISVLHIFIARKNLNVELFCLDYLSFWALLSWLFLECKSEWVLLTQRCSWWANVRSVSPPSLYRRWLCLHPLALKISSLAMKFTIGNIFSYKQDV